MRKTMLLAAGCVLLALGGIGIFLPVLPTTPFVIASAMCFSYSSEKMYNYILKSRHFGEYVRNYREKKGVRKKTKAVSLLMLWGVLALAALLAEPVWLKVLLILIGVGVSAHILSLKTRVE